MGKATCAGCGHEFTRDEYPCPECGSGDREVLVEDRASILEGLRTGARHGEPGEVSPLHLVYDEVKWNEDRQRRERRVMVVDRENKTYSQAWYHLETGEVTWEKSGRLDDPDMHGESARTSPRQRDEGHGHG
jgi:hypothetical protein